MALPLGITKKQAIMGASGLGMVGASMGINKARGTSSDGAISYGTAGMKGVGLLMFGQATKDSDFVDQFTTGARVQMLKYGQEAKSFLRRSTSIGRSAADSSIAKRIASGANRVIM